MPRYTLVEGWCTHMITRVVSVAAFSGLACCCCFCSMPSSLRNALPRVIVTRKGDPTAGGGSWAPTWRSSRWAAAGALVHRTTCREVLRLREASTVLKAKGVHITCCGCYDEDIGCRRPEYLAPWMPRHGRPANTAVI